MNLLNYYTILYQRYYNDIMCLLMEHSLFFKLYTTYILSQIIISLYNIHAFINIYF